MRRELKVFTGSAHPALGEAIAQNLSVPLGRAHLARFSDGEVWFQIHDNVRGADVFVVQPTCAPVNEHLMEMLLMLDAFKRASAARLTAVIPYYGYGRQDRKARNREPITAKLLADCLTASGADRMVSIDLHAGQIQGFFDTPVDHLTAMPVLLDYLSEHAPDDLVVVSPDAGRIKVAERFSQHLESDLAFVHKRRPKGSKNIVEALDVVGEVEGRRCVIIDDMIDTAGTIVAAGELLKEKGATEVWAMATHGVLSGPAVDRLKNSPITRVVITNTLPLPPEKQFDKVEVLSVARIIADALDAVFEDTSVSEIFGGENQS